MLHPLSHEHLINPYDNFKQARSEAPVFFHNELNMWVVTRYHEVEKVLKDPKTFSNSLTVTPMFDICPHAAQVLSKYPGGNIVSLDPPNHTRIRKALSAVFPMSIPKSLTYEPMIKKQVKRLLDQISEKKEVDLVAEFTWELPLVVLLELLGVPDEDAKQVKEWADGWLQIVWGHESEKEQIRLAYNMLKFREYARELVDQRLGKPTEKDLISKLLVYRQNNDNILSLDEIATMVFSLLIAGHETTASLIANGVYQFLKHEGIWSELASHPDKIPAAIEEVLRYDAPVISWLRFTMKEVTIGGVTIPKGQRVLVLIGSANRDEAHFNSPDSFQIDRENATDYLSFSKGPHFCIGSAFSRVEAGIALTELIRCFPNMKLADSYQASYVPNVAFRVLRSLPVVLK